VAQECLYQGNPVKAEDQESSLLSRIVSMFLKTKMVGKSMWLLPLDALSEIERQLFGNMRIVLYSTRENANVQVGNISRL
jgi:hypothetical protein